MKDTKEHILKIAFNLFLQKSFKEVTMKEIVEKTGLSKGAFYHYFSSKEQLFLEIIDDYLSLVRIDYNKFNNDSLYFFYNEYLDLWTKVVPDFINRLGFNFIYTFNFFILMFDAMNRFPGFQKEIKEIHIIELESWKKVIHSAREKGEIRSPMTDEQIAKVFTYYPEGLYLHSIFFGSLDAMIEEMKSLFDGFYKQLKV